MSRKAKNPKSILDRSIIIFKDITEQTLTDKMLMIDNGRMKFSVSGIEQDSNGNICGYVGKTPVVSFGPNTYNWILLDRSLVTVMRAEDYLEFDKTDCEVIAKKHESLGKDINTVEASLNKGGYL